MARKASWPPKLLRKPGTNQARTHWGGRWYACGPWDPVLDQPSREAVAAHAKLLQEWAADPTAKVLRADELLLAELWAAWRDAGKWDQRRLFEYEGATRSLFGTADEPGPHLETAVAEFGTKAMAAWQAALCREEKDGRQRHSAYTVRRYVSLVVECFRWGVEVERVTVGQHAALKVVRRPKEWEVRQAAERPFAAWADFQATVAGRDRSEVSDFLRLLWWTGARPSEVAGLTADMVVTAGAVRTKKGGVVELAPFGVWAAPLSVHKTARKGKERCLFFGPEAQKILAARLTRGGLLFRTRTGGRLDVKTVNKLVAKRQKNRGLVRWAIYSLRHSCADRVTRHPQFGFDAAGAYLGHAPKAVTARYAGVLWEKAAQVAAVLG